MSDNDNLKYRRESHPDFWLEQHIADDLGPPPFDFWLDVALIGFGLLGAAISLGTMLAFFFWWPQL